MIKNIRSELKEVLTHLSDYKEHSLYSLHVRFRLSPDVVRECVGYLLENNVIKLEENFIQLNRSSDVQFAKQAIYIFQNMEPNIVNDEKYTPKNKICVDELYLPKFRLLSSELKFISA